MTDKLKSDQAQTDNLADTEKYKPMVQWFSPPLLAQAGFRSMVANLFGQYSDQRIIQHLSDPILSEGAKASDPNVFDKVANRYDYSTEAVGGAPFWVDFTADLGDGFDATYAVCHTISQDALFGENSPKKVKEIAVKDWYGEPLPAGRLLILGGDEVYPYPSHAEYEARFSNPFRLALPENEQSDGSGHVEASRRDLYAIPGNHDWYDGLSAFKDLFMAAKDGPLQRKGKCIGGWQTRQHRSYFAIKLPYNWWIWGADIHLNRSLDEGQLEYFHAIAKTMGPGDKFILCTAQPSWYYWGTPEETLARENLLSLINTPIRQGAKLHGIFSGDSHHYARYQETTGKLGNFNLFTAGGGGAYTHGTFHLKPEIPLSWLGQQLKFTLNRKLEPGSANDEVLSKPKVTDEPAVYPGKTRSKTIAWMSAFMPFRNLSFALAIGLIYLLLTWTFSVISVEYDTDLENSGLNPQTLSKIKEDIKARGGMGTVAPAPITMQFDSETGELKVKKTTHEGVKQIIGGWTLDLIEIFRARIAEITKKNITGFEYVKEWLGAVFILFRQGTDLLLIGIAASPMSFALLLGFWFVLYMIAQSKRVGNQARISRFFTASLHFVVHLISMWGLFCAFLFLNFSIIKPWFEGMGITRFLGAPLGFWIPSLTAVEMIPVGGIVGGIIFGIYLALGYRLFKVNADWVFSSQRITRFKCFLKMCVEPDKLTIYPIGIDVVPTRTGPVPGWTWTENPVDGEPRLQPRTLIQARLIEGPIVIRTGDVQNLERAPIV